MTSQGCICVQCVTNGLCRKLVWLTTEQHSTLQRSNSSVLCVRDVLRRNDAGMITRKDTSVKWCIHVLSVRNIFHVSEACSSIEIFTVVNTSAQNVADVVKVVISWQHTDEVIQERNRLNVLFVENDSQRLEILLDTAEFTVERNYTNVTCVTRRLVSLDIWTLTSEFTQFTVETNDTTVLTVGSCLRQTLNWSIMFVFTLMQSCTHVDTVQTVSEHLPNWRDICWSHTVKVLGSHVTFVRINLAAVITLSYIYFDMKMWSRMLVVNVQSVSILHRHWKFTILCTQMLNSSAVVHVANFLSVRHT